MQTPQEKALHYAINAIKNWEYNHFIRKVYLYGSFARGDFSINSDVDLYIECDEGIPNRELRLFRAAIIPVEENHAEVDLHYGFAPLHEQEGLYYDNIRKEGKILWERK